MTTFISRDSDASGEIFDKFKQPARKNQPENIS